MKEAEGLGCFPVGGVHCAVNGSGFFKGSGRGVKEDQFEVKHIAAAGVEDVHATDGLPPLSTEDVVRSVRYLVCPVVRGRPWLTSSDDDFLVILTVCELVEGGVNRSAQVAVQFGNGDGSSYLFVAFLEDDMVTARQVDR